MRILASELPLIGCKTSKIDELRYWRTKKKCFRTYSRSIRKHSKYSNIKLFNAFFGCPQNLLAQSHSLDGIGYWLRSEALCWRGERDFLNKSFWQKVSVEFFFLLAESPCRQLNVADKTPKARVCWWSWSVLRTIPICQIGRSKRNEGKLSPFPISTTFASGCWRTVDLVRSRSSERDLWSTQRSSRAINSD